MPLAPSKPASMVLQPLTVPTYPLTARLTPAAIASCLALHIANGIDNRADLARASNLSRTTVATGVDFLTERGLLERSTTHTPDGRGRPSDRLHFAAPIGLIAVADLGVTSSTVSLFTPDQTCLGSRLVFVDLARGPEIAVPALLEHLQSLISSLDETYGTVEICMIAVPGPVDARRSGVNRPPLLKGWGTYSLENAFVAALGCPVIVDKDVNLRALGEARTSVPTDLPLILVKVASAIEAGIVLANGDLYRGVEGFAGDVGHIASRAAGDKLCACGNTGCLQTIASTDALVSQLSELRDENLDLGDFERLVGAGDPAATRILREAVRGLGEVLAGLVNFTNPSRIVLSGTVTHWNPGILSGLRGAIYERALPIATSRLTVSTAVHGDWSGAAGALTLALEAIFSAERLSSLSVEDFHS
ncbi:ROK family protein [Arthrobacter sp. GMC3]|uniref:ROK family protein n=1 Tax=Arthrobacter sp. GMC3 TaxID=2058894 RepID=UPI0015E457E0|nr:ROK family protein [Arthrobacter sp. GMC3]